MNVPTRRQDHPCTTLHSAWNVLRLYSVAVTLPLFYPRRLCQGWLLSHFLQSTYQLHCFKPLALGPAAKDILQVFPGPGWEEGEVGTASNCSGLWDSSRGQQPRPRPDCSNGDGGGSWGGE